MAILSLLGALLGVNVRRARREGSGDVFDADDAGRYGRPGFTIKGSVLPPDEEGPSFEARGVEPVVHTGLGRGHDEGVGPIAADDGLRAREARLAGPVAAAGE